MAQNQPMNTGVIAHDQPVMNGSARPDRVPPARKPSRQVAASSRLNADVAEVIFDVHRLEAIVEDLAVVVARLGRVTGGIGDVEERLDNLERTFGT